MIIAISKQIKKLKIIANFEENEENIEENEENENEAIKGNNTTLKIKLYESNGDLLFKLFNVDGSTKNFYNKFVPFPKLWKILFKLFNNSSNLFF